MKKAIYYKLEGKKQNRRLTLGREYEYFEYDGCIMVFSGAVLFDRSIKFSSKDFDKYFIDTQRQRKLKLIKLKKINESR